MRALPTSERTDKPPVVGAEEVEHIVAGAVKGQGAGDVGQILISRGELIVIWPARARRVARAGDDQCGKETAYTSHHLAG